MQTRILLLAPVLISIAGCSEKIEAQTNDSASTEFGIPADREDREENAVDEQETDLKLRSPVGID